MRLLLGVIMAISRNSCSRLSGRLLLTAWVNCDEDPHAEVQPHLFAQNLDRREHFPQANLDGEDRCAAGRQRLLLDEPVEFVEAAPRARLAQADETPPHRLVEVKSSVEAEHQGKAPR